MSLDVKRHVLGVCALVLVLVGGWMWLVYEQNVLRMTANGLLRAGMTLGALWLAFPQVLTICRRVSPRMLLALVFGVVALIVRPRALPLVLVVLAAVGLLELAGHLLNGGKRR